MALSKTGEIVKAFKITIHDHDLKTLKGRNWLNDEVKASFTFIRYYKEYSYLHLIYSNFIY